MPKCNHLASGLVMLCVALTARAQNPFESVKAFSATFVMSGMPSNAQQGSVGTKIYRSGGKIRTDLPGGAGYTIVDTPARTSYMVMGNGMCMQMTAKEQQNPFAQAPDVTTERSSAGTETVNGHLCKVENLTITQHSGPRAGQATHMKVWEAQDMHGFPIKMEMQTERGLITTEYKDISLTEPDASLFVHPDNCRQMPGMPGGSPH
jgi:outer membrane lipoprotein-sorting protein